MKSCMATGTKGGLAIKRHNLMVASVMKHKPTVGSHYILQKAERQTCLLYSNTGPKKEIAAKDEG